MGKYFPRKLNQSVIFSISFSESSYRCIKVGTIFPCTQKTAADSSNFYPDGVALDRAFQANAKVSVKNQLKTQISALLTVLEIDSEGNLSIPERMPENRLTSPNSGLYAVILDEQGRIIWRSRSSIGIPLDYLQVAQPGRESFYYSFEITWEVGLAKEVALTWR